MNLKKKPTDRTPRDRKLYAYSDPNSIASREANDCAVRAAAIACCVDYDTAHAVFKKHGREDRKGTRNCVSLEAVAELAGGPMEEIKIPRDHVQIKRYDSWSGDYVNSWRKVGMTVARFVREYPTGHYFVTVNGHAFAVIDGVVHDWGKQSSGSRKQINTAWRVA